MRQIIAALLALSVAAPAPAWNRPGHMVTAAIAYHVMKERSPAALERVLSILRRHPDYDARWLDRLNEVEVEDADVYLLMLAARWPDDIRRRKEYDRPADYYVDYAFIPPGQPAGLKPPPLPRDSILTGFRRNLGVLKDPRA